MQQCLAKIRPIWASMTLWPSHLPLVKDVLRNDFAMNRLVTSGTISLSETCNHYVDQI